MNLPECPYDRTDCQFAHENGWRTLMHSPVIYDRDGKAISGGGNNVEKWLRCIICDRQWMSSQKELEDAQGKPRDWILK
jgi:hypothetical protein